MPSKAFMEVPLNKPIDILVANVTNSPVYVPKNTVLSASRDSTVRNIDPEQVNKERHYTVPTTQPASKPPAQVD